MNSVAYHIAQAPENGEVMRVVGVNVANTLLSAAFKVVSAVN